MSYLWSALCLLALLWAPGAAAIQEISREEIGAWLDAHRTTEASFSAGDVLGAADLDKIRPFVPPGLHSDFDFPEFQMEIAQTGDYPPHPLYEAASLQFSGQTSLASDGALTNYVAGQPFSNEALDQAPPEQAGLMAAWNANFRWQHYGQRVILAHTLFLKEKGSPSNFSQFPDNMVVGGGHLERSVDIEWRRTYFSHLPQLADTGYRFDLPGAEKAIYKELTEYLAPFEFRDQKLLAERWADPHADDTLNAYLPNERKVRRLSAKEKSDTWLGSEITFDDFYGFDGHVLDNTWRYLGRRQLLVVANTKHAYAQHGGPHSRVPNDRWELREMIVVEGSPTLEDHPYGSRVLFYDAQNYQFMCGLYFDPQGQLMRGSLPISSWSEDTLDHPEENRGAHVLMYKGYAFINFQNGNTTLTNVVKTTYPEPKASKIRRIYGVDSLNEGR